MSPNAPSAVASPGRQDVGRDRHRPLPEYSASFPLSPAEERSLAWNDIVQGASACHRWGVEPVAESVRQFRRTIIGPYLPVLNRSLGILVAGLLFRKLLDVGMNGYMSNLIAGLFVWLLIQSFFRAGGKAFARAGDVIEQSGPPLSVHVYEAVWRALIGFGYNAPLLIIAALVFERWGGLQALLAIPGLALLALNGFWVTLLMATLSLKFGFLSGVVKRTMRIAFLGTPILWLAQQFPDHQALINANPFYHCVEVVRGPLLGKPPPLASWAIVACIAVVGWFVTIRVYARFRRQIPFLV